MTTAGQAAPMAVDDRRLITVASGKGGVGKTWLSITLSHALASMGRKVLLFDGDLGLANVDIQLGITPHKDLGAVITGDASLKDVAQSYDIGQDQFDIIPGRSGSGSLGNLNRDMLGKIRAGLIDRTQDYDHVILDLAAGIDPSVLALSHHGGTLLVVMTADPTSLTDAYAFIKMTAGRKAGAKVKVVVNNVPSEREGKLAFEKIRKVCEGFLKLSPELAGIISHDARVMDSIRSQIPLLVRHPQSDAAKDVSRLAQTLTSA